LSVAHQRLRERDPILFSIKAPGYAADQTRKVPMRLLSTQRAATRWWIISRSLTMKANARISCAAALPQQ
jgi:hypothetical protein